MCRVACFSMMRLNVRNAASVCWLDAEFVAEDSINTFFTVVDIV